MNKYLTILAIAGVSCTLSSCSPSPEPDQELLQMIAKSKADVERASVHEQVRYNALSKEQRRQENTMKDAAAARSRWQPTYDQLEEYWRSNH